MLAKSLKSSKLQVRASELVIYLPEAAKSMGILSKACNTTTTPKALQAASTASQIRYGKVKDKLEATMSSDHVYCGTTMTSLACGHWYRFMQAIEAHMAKSAQADHKGSLVQTESQQKTTVRKKARHVCCGPTACGYWVCAIYT